MYKIINHLYVSKVEAILLAEQANFSILGCCKEPLHRKHARVRGSNKEGYITKSIPQDEPEYFFAERDHALYCNLVNSYKADLIPDNVIQRALQFIDDELLQDRNVLVVGNRGESRSASIAFMYLISSGYFSECKTFNEAYAKFHRIYPLYSPEKGFYEYTERFFNDFMKGIS